MYGFELFQESDGPNVQLNLDLLNLVQILFVLLGYFKIDLNKKREECTLIS